MQDPEIAIETSLL